MTAVRSKPSGYGLHDIFTSAEAEIIDSQLPDLIDGGGGSAGTPYEPTTPVEIAGSGFIFRTTLDTAATCTSTLDGDVEFPNGFTCTGTATTSFGNNNVTIGSGGEFTAYCETFFNGDVNFTAAGGVFQCDKPTAFSHNVGCSGLLTCSLGLRVASGTTQLESATIASGPFTASGGLSIEGSSGATVGTTLATSFIALTGRGYLRKRPPVVDLGLDGNATISTDSGDYFRPPSLSLDRTWILNTPPGDGVEIEISLIACSGTHTLTLIRQSDSSTVMLMQNTTNKPYYAKLLYRASTDWIVGHTIVGPSVATA